MRFYTIALLANIMLFHATADADVATAAIEEAKSVTKQSFPAVTKTRVEASPFQQYNTHAQCARLANRAGNDFSSRQHLSAALSIRPKEVPKSDISYRYGFVDGMLAAEWEGRRRRHTIKQIAFATYKKNCPRLM